MVQRYEQTRKLQWYKRGAAYESIKDDGTGGDSEKNNREYSGSFTRDGNGVNAVFPINIAK